MTVGVSVLLDFFGVQSLEHHRADLWEELLERAIVVGNLTMLQIASHQFPGVIHQESQGKPGGATAFALLAESHISVHTWPEKAKIVIDVFTCGSESGLTSLIDYLKAQVPHTTMTITRILRGEKE